MRKTFRALVGAALVFAFTFVSTGVASADYVHKSQCAKTGENPHCLIWWGISSSSWLNSDGWAVFTSDGEWLEIQDEAVDGMGIYVRIKYTLGSYTYYDHVYSFSGPSEHREVRNYDLPEGTLVHIHACQTNNGREDINCINANIQA
jgi:hypothetical protein